MGLNDAVFSVLSFENKRFSSWNVNIIFLSFFQVPANTTTVSTKHDDIAHFTCTSRVQAAITWKRETTDLTNNDVGVAMLSVKNGATWESHLFIAVTDDDLRGKYTCMSSDKPDVVLQAFIIESKAINRYFFFYEERTTVKFRK